ncbi:MAG: bleomycin resistance protein [Rivularia sp. ALOHA_DT_140]|nr:bleomycin resistance protein [Rivularia sp. ALOHA_DT_140]
MILNKISLNLIVIRVEDLIKSKDFYETLGIKFDYEQHGQGEKHLSTVLEGMIFEIYPRNNNLDTSALRLGFRVSSVDKIIEKLEKIEAVILSPPKNSTWGRRAVISDPDHHKIELIEL